MVDSLYWGGILLYVTRAEEFPWVHRASPLLPVPPAGVPPALAVRARAAVIRRREPGGSPSPSRAWRLLVWPVSWPPTRSTAPPLAPRPCPRRAVTAPARPPARRRTPRP